MSYNVIGVDPAPTKKTVSYDGAGWHVWRPQDLRHYVANVEAPAIIAWDAPLSFDRADFYGRRVDRTVARWAASLVKEGRFEPKAVNARSFAGLPHWAVTCDALGMPFGDIPRGCILAEAAPPLDSQVSAVIEVHPAVALAIWWLEAGVSAPFPRYKGRAFRDGSARISKTLDFPAGAGESDDHLDAYVAYTIGTLFRDGKANWLGGPKSGGYVLPDSPTTNALRDRYAER